MSTGSPMYLFSFISLIFLRIWGMFPFSIKPILMGANIYWPGRSSEGLSALSVLLYPDSYLSVPQSTPNTRRFSLKYFTTAFLMASLSSPSLLPLREAWGVGPVSVSLLQVRTHRLKEVEELSQVHSANGWESQAQSIYQRLASYQWWNHSSFKLFHTKALK